MTTISKELKYASFEYAEETKMFSISDPNGNKIELNKVYAFAFMRFVIRMAQRNWLRTKPPQKREAQLERMACEGLLAEIEEDADHPDQTHFSYES
tara:strand:- start:955 stop:1242 length:288 start_codon:yes stop_codon:yes gene_type:complete